MKCDETQNNEQLWSFRKHYAVFARSTLRHPENNIITSYYHSSLTLMFG